MTHARDLERVVATRWPALRLRHRAATDDHIELAYDLPGADVPILITYRHGSTVPVRIAITSSLFKLHITDRDIDTACDRVDSLIEDMRRAASMMLGDHHA